ncbi:MAG: DUF1194 domain-containing protein [Rhizobiaceae bacterium]
MKFCFLMVACAVYLTSPALARQEVELELVLAIDSSTSVDADEYELQRTGLAQAFRHPRVLSAIEGLGEAGLAVAIVQWAGNLQQRISVDWTWINSTQSAFAFADRVSRMPRQLSGFTDIAGAIRFSTDELLGNGYLGRRLAIDVSGDGTSDRNDPAIARDAAILQGITINGLVIHSVEYDLGDLARYELHTHYTERVIGGPGAFLLNAESFDTFAKSIREKLYREISGPLFVEMK